MRPGVAFAALAAALGLAAFLGLALGAREIAPSQIWAALVAPDPADPAHVVLRELRLPRLAAALIAGAGLGLAGVLMQATTRNPLAEPGLLGINAGAGCAVVIGIYLLGIRHPALLALMAFPGAALAATAVFLLSAARGGADSGGDPVRMTLAGVALNALLMSIVSAIVLTSAEVLDVYRFWVVGSLAEAAGRPLAMMAPVVLAGAVLAFAIAGQLDTLALGDEAARGLGTRVGAVRALVLLAVTLLCGAAVVVAGPIAFLGLAVPHLARMLTGPGVGASLALAVLLGPLILILADTAGRLILPPAEIRVGTMAGFFGGILFILIARRMRPGARA